MKINHRVEGSMVQFHLGREITNFGSYYFKRSVSCFQNRPSCHDDGGETMKHYQSSINKAKVQKNAQGGILVPLSCSLHLHMSY